MWVLVIVCLVVFMLYKYMKYSQKRSAVYDARRIMSEKLVDIYRQSVFAYRYLVEWYKSEIINEIFENDVRNIARLMNILDAQIPKTIDMLENSDPIKQFDGYHKNFEYNGPRAVITAMQFFIECYPEYTSTANFSNALTCYQKMLEDVSIYNSYIDEYNSIITAKGYDLVAFSGPLEPLRTH